MPFSPALRITQSAWAKYLSLGVEKSPGVVKGASPASFSGGFWQNLCSINSTMMVLKPFWRRFFRYCSTSPSGNPTISDQAASPCSRKAALLWSTRYLLLALGESCVTTLGDCPFPITVPSRTPIAHVATRILLPPRTVFRVRSCMLHPLLPGPNHEGSACS